MDDPDSPVYPTRLPETCGSCHSDPTFVEKFDIPRVQPIEAYRASVHAQLVEAGLPGPTCNDCHDSHGIYPGFDPRSSVSHRNVSSTCGKCHEDIVSEYAESVHGEAAMKGIPEAPACTDCHGEHRILSPAQPDSPTYATNMPKMTCERCHADVTLAAKFGLDVDKVGQYEDSYHGLASQSGRVTVANCGSCHGVHDVLPSSDPRSHIHPENLADTCGQCHPGAGETFAIGEIHIDEHDRANAGVYWVRQIYLWLIFGTIGFMLVHNGLDLYRKARGGIPRAPSGEVPDEGVRMVPGFRIAHMIMLISFAILVYSGFALKYPEAWWAAPLRSTGEFDLRGWVHRFGAILMLAAVAVHFVHLAIDQRARACFVRGMVPTLSDVREFRERIRWYLGLRPDPPHTPTLGYPEKMEYLALMWGIVVMTVTGFLLWFENWTLARLP
ncbi:MAG: cytochrome b/b6 domain-containing protein, partial [Synechococcaceae cyanobacterium]|nr:cytochrome b/b6 domain-containing protein [Synechococcaceae cyanobacterium]